MDHHGPLLAVRERVPWLFLLKHSEVVKSSKCYSTGRFCSWTVLLCFKIFVSQRLKLVMKSSCTSTCPVCSPVLVCCCHVLTVVPFLCLCFSFVRAWVVMGILGFVFLCVWPGMVPNQMQLAIVVSDWEPYLGSLFPPVFVGSCFLSLCVCTRQNCFVCFRFFVLMFSFFIKSTMNTYHAAPWLHLLPPMTTVTAACATLQIHANFSIRWPVVSGCAWHCLVPGRWCKAYQWCQCCHPVDHVTHCNNKAVFWILLVASTVVKDICM